MRIDISLPPLLTDLVAYFVGASFPELTDAGEMDSSDPLWEEKFTVN
jgi:hypothetical protein